MSSNLVSGFRTFLILLYIYKWGKRKVKRLMQLKGDKCVLPSQSPSVCGCGCSSWHRPPHHTVAPPRTPGGNTRSFTFDLRTFFKIPWNHLISEARNFLVCDNGHVHGHLNCHTQKTWLSNVQWLKLISQYIVFWNCLLHLCCDLLVCVFVIDYENRI